MFDYSWGVTALSIKNVQPVRLIEPILIIETQKYLYKENVYVFLTCLSTKLLGHFL